MPFFPRVFPPCLGWKAAAFFWASVFPRPISFLFPMAFFLLAKGREEALEAGELSDLGEMQSFEDSNEAQEAAAVCGQEETDGERESSLSLSSGTAQGSSVRLMQQAFRSLPAWEKLLLCLTATFILATMVFGVAEEIKQVVEMWGEFGAPFSCHHLREPDRPTCS
ncbi:unnamed protein product [Effrenium voratum]|nr:unnamed protein product [Effrenium voratum]